MWKDIEAAPADSILGLTDAYRKETNPKKVNLGVGVYKDDDGNTPILESVKAAEKILLIRESTKSYLPISGDAVYAECVQKLLFGKNSEVVAAGRAATVHAPGGTGALRVGGELLKIFRPEATVWVSTPTWANHIGIFSSSGFQIEKYPYYNSDNKSLNFEELLGCLEKIPEKDIVLMHACCHNPSGVDLNQEQWQQVVAIAKKRRWLPYLDFAYQGFGSGVEEDRNVVELFAEARCDFFIASSFSKNLGLYNERTGALTIVSPTAEESVVALSHLKATVRVIYSNPPAHGGLAAAQVLNNESLYNQWIKELDVMRLRIVEMRNALVDGLAKRGVDTDFSYIKEQRGMFSFSGLTDDIVTWLREQKGIYVVGGGRINLAGLTTKNIDYVCDSIAEALKK